MASYICDTIAKRWHDKPLAGQKEDKKARQKNKRRTKKAGKKVLPIVLYQTLGKQL
jgi:hypothetical protein